MRKVETFSVDTIKDSDVLERLIQVGNKSQYIKELIRNDILNGTELTEGQRAEVVSIVNSILNENNFKIESQVEELDQDLVDALDQFEIE